MGELCGAAEARYIMTFVAKGSPWPAAAAPPLSKPPSPSHPPCEAPLLVPSAAAHWLGSRSCLRPSGCPVIERLLRKRVRRADIFS